MTRFYQNLLGRRPALDQPLPKGAALAEAKRWLRNLTPEEIGRLNSGQPIASSAAHPYEHPYYWASFILVGDPGNVSKVEPVLATSEPIPTPNLYLFGLIGAGIALVFVGGIVRARFICQARPC